MSKLSEIEDYYKNKGFHGKKLENALRKDKQYQKELKEKRQNTKKFHKLATKKEMQKYPLPTKEDFIIINLVGKLKREKLSKNDNEIVNLILSQLEYDWRKGLLEKLNKLSKKYII